MESGVLKDWKDPQVPEVFPTDALLATPMLWMIDSLRSCVLCTLFRQGNILVLTIILIHSGGQHGSNVLEMTRKSLEPLSPEDQIVTVRTKLLVFQMFLDPRSFCFYCDQADPWPKLLKAKILPDPPPGSLPPRGSHPTKNHSNRSDGLPLSSVNQDPQGPCDKVLIRVNQKAKRLSTLRPITPFYVLPENSLAFWFFPNACSDIRWKLGRTISAGPRP